MHTSHFGGRFDRIRLFGRVTRTLVLLAVLCGVPGLVAGGPIEPQDASGPLSFDTSAGPSYSLITTGSWSLIFDEQALSVSEESAWPLLPGGRDRSQPLGPAFKLASGRRDLPLEDVQRAVLSRHVWNPLGFLPQVAGVVDWSPLVLSSDAFDEARPGTLVAFRARLARPSGAGSRRLRYLTPATPQLVTLLPTRPGSESSGSGTGADLGIGIGGTPLLDSPQSIPAPPPVVLTMLGLGWWMVRRARQR